MPERLVLYQDWLYVDTEAGVARRFSTEQEAVDWVVCKRKELHGEYAVSYDKAR